MGRVNKGSNKQAKYPTVENTTGFPGKYSVPPPTHLSSHCLTPIYWLKQTRFQPPYLHEIPLHWPQFIDPDPYEPIMVLLPEMYNKDQEIPALVCLSLGEEEIYAESCGWRLVGRRSLLRKVDQSILREE